MSWRSVPINAISSFNPSPPKGLVGSNIEVAFVPMASVSELGSMTVTDHRPGSDLNTGFSYFQSGDVLVAKITPCYENNKTARVKIDREHGFGSTEFHVLRPDRSKLDSAYLTYFLRQDSVREAGTRRMTGSGGQRRVPRGFLEALEIPLPPLEEQRRIAMILDQADALRRKRRETRKKLNSLRSAIFQHTFGEFTGHETRWPIDILENVVRPGTIVTYGMVQAGEEFAGGVPYVRTGDIVGGEIIASQLKRADPAIAKKFDRSKVRAGDIVISIRATVGTTAMVPPLLDGANLTQGTAKIAPGPLTEPIYLLDFLRSDGPQNWISKQVKGATFREITLTRLREMPIQLPPIEIQQRYVRHVDEVIRSGSLQDEQLTTLDFLFASLQHRAFTGQLTTKTAERELADAT